MLTEIVSTNMAIDDLPNDVSLYPGMYRTSTDLMNSHTSPWHGVAYTLGDQSVNSYSARNSSGNNTNKITGLPWAASSGAAAAACRSQNQSESSSPHPIGATGGSGLRYDWRLNSLMLCRHILLRGLFDGIGSDITVHVPAWNKTYNLHRLILDQNQYFRVMLEGGFRETSSDSITLHFENNPFITEESFYFVLTQLYGKLYDPCINAENVRRILATCSFFQLDHMSDLCVDYILRTLNDSNVVTYLTFADENMVCGSDRILSATMTYLYREAYSMDVEHLIELPVSYLKKVIECDAFWVPSEYDRYRFAHRVLTTRHRVYKLQHQGPDDDDNDDNCTTPSIEKEPAVDVEDILSDDFQKCSIYVSVPRPGECENVDEELQVFHSIFTHSIHYVHMTFEQLEAIRSDVNPFTGAPLVPDHILKDALWQQIRMRARIEGIGEHETTLGLTIPEHEATKQQTEQLQLIPSNDMTVYTGESSTATTSMSSPSAAINQESKRRRTAAANTNTESESKKPEGKQYSLYPPFRFSVEFADFAKLEHNIRVYSKTVFYAGSNWNMYIQKTRSLRKGVLQLGVYLHRQSIPFGHCNHRENGPSHQENGHQHCTRLCTPNLSPFSRYADKREKVKTWFKIYCPARGPRHTLTLFQSSPDVFAVLQSWGWRSTTLCADEALSSGHNNASGGEAAVHLTTDTTSHGNSSQPNLARTPDTQPAGLDEIPVATASIPVGSANLRFSIVMGHI
ncbi:hypothetical protein BX666DRAFT_1912777 [Dichotomocladium elegans]|nr:hypothetical protein BX666DRAFT_1912777 [Dichotomocladium elegans]